VTVRAKMKKMLSSLMTINTGLGKEG